MEHLFKAAEKTNAVKSALRKTEQEFIEIDAKKQQLILEIEVY